MFVSSKSLKVRLSNGYGKMCKFEYMKVRTYVTRGMLYFSAIAATPHSRKETFGARLEILIIFNCFGEICLSLSLSREGGARKAVPTPRYLRHCRCANAIQLYRNCCVMACI